MIDMNKFKKTMYSHTIYVPPKHRTILAYLCEKTNIEFQQTYATKLRSQYCTITAREYWAERFSKLDGTEYTYTQTSGFTARFEPETMFEICKKALKDDDVIRMLRTCNF